MKKEKLSPTIILLVTIITIIAVLGFAVTSTLIQSPPTFEIPQQTTTYQPITVENAKTLIDKNISLVVIDIRTCDCNYKKGHIPNAVWEPFPGGFYGTTNDLIVYCANGTKSIDYCEQLIGHTFGDIYYLQGGIEAWEDKGYPII